MKGIVQRPQWPAPAAKTATRPGHTNSTNDQSRPSNTATDLDETAAGPIDPFNRITLAVLEEYSAAKTKGYDPYNTSAAAHRPRTVWDRKRKRD
jgi:hypothetical protein